MNGTGGGASLSTLELVAEFRKSGIESVIVSDDAGTPEERRIVSDAVGGRILFRPLYWWNRKNRAPAWRRPLIELAQQWRTGWLRASTADVVAFARLHDVDLIHTNTSLTLEGGFAARELGLPHVWHIRELIGPGFPYRFAVEGPAFGNYLKNLASLFVANSNVTANAILGWLPEHMLRVVPNGINLERFEVVRAVTHRDRIVVGMVANLSSILKKQRLFLETAARVAVSVPVEFRIYGHPPTTHAARAAWQANVQELQMTDRFHFAGFVSDPVKIMSDIDVLVHTSDHESFGRVIVEAMAAGKPVVGVRGGGVGEVLIDGETGLLADPNDCHGLARHLERLIGNAELRERFGSAGKRRARSEYAVQRCADHMLQVYSEAMLRPLGNHHVQHGRSQKAP